MTDGNATPARVVYKPMPGFPDYRAGDDGSIWTIWYHGRRYPGVWRRKKLSINRWGYNFVKLSRDKKAHPMYVHRLILEAFVGRRPPGMEARHLNGVPTDNRLANLCWGTHSENEADKARHKAADRSPVSSA